MQDSGSGDVRRFLDPLRRVHAALRDRVLEACENCTLEELGQVDRDSAEDTIYRVDRIGEDALLDLLRRELVGLLPLVVVVEGLTEGFVLHDEPLDPAQPVSWRLLIDPIDGTRGLMAGKRSAWILTGVASNRGESTRLADIELAVQTEVPTPKQHLVDTAWAIRGQGAQAVREDRVRGGAVELALRPSQASTIAHGFATVSRFFPGHRERLGALDDELFHRVLGTVPQGRALTFEDQYISSAGQLWGLMTGSDRFVADLRPLVATSGETSSLTCHPYDLATELIARESGVVVEDPWGEELAPPLDTTTPCAWVGYANAAIRDQVAPHLRAVLAEAGLSNAGG